jgi:hypothetical protein
MQQRISQLRAELKSNGAIFRAQCAAVAEELLVETYKRAMDPESGFAVKMELLKYAAKLADLEPKPQQNTFQGTGFSITINIPQVGNTIDVTPETPKNDLVSVEIPTELPPLPVFLAKMRQNAHLLDDLALPEPACA